MAPVPSPPATPFAPFHAAFERLRLVWAVPVLALLLGGYLVGGKFAARGPEITINFATASGISAGTKIEHKGVLLGQVTAVSIKDVNGPAAVHVRMQSAATPFLTDHARFWVARVQLSGGSITGLQSVISGGYIEMDPGERGGRRLDTFNGLANPPGDRSDEPGTTFVLTAPTVASLSTGAGVFFRDKLVGEVLDTKLDGEHAPARAAIFVRRPYDSRVRTGSVFWQASGLQNNVTNDGLNLQLTSLQAVISGGVAFAVPPYARDAGYPQAARNTSFRLFDKEDDAYRASYQVRIPYALHFTESTAGLAPGSPVLLQGTQVGEVTSLRLAGVLDARDTHVQVMIELLPQAMDIVGAGQGDLGRRLIEAGLSAKIETVSYVRNSQAITLGFTKPAPTRITQEDGALVMPTQAGAATGGVVSRVQNAVAAVVKLPFGPLGNALDATLRTAAGQLGVLQSSGFRTVLARVQSLRTTIADANAKITPLLRSLPAQADRVNAMLGQANNSLSSLDTRYGSGSGLPGEIAYQVQKYYNDSRYYRLLADYLNRHPEAIARGTTGRANER